MPGRMVRRLSGLQRSCTYAPMPKPCCDCVYLGVSVFWKQPLPVISLQIPASSSPPPESEYDTPPPGTSVEESKRTKRDWRPIFASCEPMSLPRSEIEGSNWIV